MDNLKDILERKRMDALSKRNPLEYFEYCVASNIDHTENSQLFEEGAALFDIKRKDPNPNYAALPVEARYVLLRQKAKAQGLSTRLDGDAERKRKLIAMLFPGRFGQNPVQDVSGYEPAQVGALFNGLMKTAKGAEYDFNR